MVRFNPPPGWPLPDGWSPTPQWSPDPAWPPAPPGWVFWVADEAAGAEEVVDDRAAGKSVPRWTRPLVVVGSLSIIAALTLVIVIALSLRPIEISTLPHTSTMTPEWTLRPDWPSPQGLNVDFTLWDRFGGIDAKFDNDGRSVVLDTHDTTETWRTKWSGLVQQGPPRCDLRITGRVRDISHTVGVPGGFAIGLATLAPGDPATADLTGTAIQFDFGVEGYRAAIYPDDSDRGIVGTQLDGQWHDIEVRIDTAGHTLMVDGQTVVQSDDGGQCGNPVIRVWAGSAEFADFSFLPN